MRTSIRDKVNIHIVVRLNNLTINAKNKIVISLTTFSVAKSSRRTEKEFVQRKKFWKNWIFLFGKIGGCVSIYIDLSKITKSGRVNSIPY